jgi:hypothetical protein
VPDPSPAGLLAAAREVAGTCTEPYRPRAVALLARQALETALDDHWRTRAAGVEECPTRTQLICLPVFLRDTALAERTSYTWWALTRACHHHPYDLAPTPSELADLLSAVGDLTARLQPASIVGSGIT